MSRPINSISTVDQQQNWIKASQIRASSKDQSRKWQMKAFWSITGREKLRKSCWNSNATLLTKGKISVPQKYSTSILVNSWLWESKAEPPLFTDLARKRYWRDCQQREKSWKPPLLLRLTKIGVSHSANLFVSCFQVSISQIISTSWQGLTNLFCICQI